jgi:hypothetical protein
MTICGNNFQPHRRSEYSYYFSRYAHVWGWASWRRAWQDYDVSIPAWPNIKLESRLRSAVDSQAELAFWTEIFDRQHAGEIDTWDYPWLLACWLNHGLSIVPEVNLVTNIGFGAGATHTVDTTSRFANLPTTSIGQLHNPAFVIRNFDADRYTFQHVFDSGPAVDLEDRRKSGGLKRWLFRKKAA